MRFGLMLGVLLLCTFFVPMAAAHDPPPEASGIIFALSGEGGDLSLIRQELGAASQGSRLVNSGGSTDIGTWLSEPLTSALNIEGAEALVVVYVLPVGIVLGAGMHISVTVSVDGEEVQSGDSETIILNEPLWINIPWTSDEFDIVAEPGQVIEMNVIATIEGVGAARVQWGNEADSPSIFSLANWYINNDESILQNEISSELVSVFSTPWNCSDIESVSFESRGPVADHDIMWADAPEAIFRVALREGCSFTVDITDMEGTYLHRWQILMSDGMIINKSGYFEHEELNSEAATQPFTFSLMGGIVGLILLSTPLIAQFFAIPISMAGIMNSREMEFADSVQNKIPHLLGLATIGLITGLLTTPFLAFITCVGLLALGWATSDL